jgi:hypothetical protein
MITYKNYTLEPEQGRFNLFVTKISEKGNERKENLGWGITLERAIEHMIVGEGEEDQSLPDYLINARNLFADIQKHIK